MNFLVNSDCGDVIYLLPMIKAMGGGNVFFSTDNRPDATTKWDVRFNVAKPLLLNQSYINIVKYHEGESIDWPIDIEKTHCRSAEEQVFVPYGHLMLKNHDFTLSTFNEPWLDVQAADHDFDIIINRTARYITSHYHMQELLSVFQGQRAAFVGLSEEWEVFSKTVGQLHFLKTDNLLELAQVIKGAKLFIGNQSCPLAIAEGLKQNVVQETCRWCPNCCFNRPGFYSFHDTGNYRMIGSSLPLSNFFGVPIEEVEDPISENTTPTPAGLYPYKKLANYFYKMKTQ